jgi:hypothetical protein
MQTCIAWDCEVWCVVLGLKLMKMCNKKQYIYFICTFLCMFHRSFFVLFLPTRQKLNGQISNIVLNYLFSERGKRVINVYTTFLNCGHLFDPFVLGKMWLLFKFNRLDYHPFSTVTWCLLQKCYHYVCLSASDTGRIQIVGSIYLFSIVFIWYIYQV